MVVVRGRGVVAQLAVLDDRVADVDPEARHPALEPEAQHVVERLADLRVPPVEVRLRREEVVEEVLARGLVERPRRAAEVREPVVRRPSVGGRVGPHVEVAVAGVAAAQRVAEPRMAVAGVVGDEVEQHADAAPSGLLDQLVEVVERAQLGMDAAVVGDVVAPVVVGRRHRRVEPDAIDAEPLEMVEALDYAPQVADPVAIGIRVGAGIDLVQDAVLPPRHGVAGYELPCRLPSLTDGVRSDSMESVPRRRGRVGALVTIAEVAKQAGVGVATVSRVLNGSPAVRERRVGACSTRSRSSATRRTRPRARCRPAAASRSRSSPPSSRARRSWSACAASPTCSPAPATSSCCSTWSGRARRTDYFRRLSAGGGLDALLSISLCPRRTTTSSGSPRPACRSSSSTSPHRSVPSVHTDDVAGGRLATEHLLELGHRRIAFLGDFEHNYYGFMSSARRRTGYEEALAAAGVEADPALLLRGPHGREAAAALTREALDRPNPPTAVLRGLRHPGGGCAGGGRGARRKSSRRPLGRRLRRHRAGPPRGPDHRRATAREERSVRCRDGALRPRGRSHPRPGTSGDAGRATHDRRIR